MILIIIITIIEQNSFLCGHCAPVNFVRGEGSTSRVLKSAKRLVVSQAHAMRSCFELPIKKMI